MHDLLNIFLNWARVKYSLNIKESRSTVRERQIYWCSVGYNVGHEENGKGDKYRRPILVFKKFNDRLFWGIPMTTKVKENPYYVKVNVDEEVRCVMVSQLRVMDANRIIEPMERLSLEEFKKVKDSINSIIDKIQS